MQEQENELVTFFKLRTEKDLFPCQQGKYERELVLF